jgi:uncharacterized protein (DUF2141 family)
LGYFKFHEPLNAPMFEKKIMNTNTQKLFFTAAFLMTGLCVFAQSKLEVTVTNIKAEKGTIRVGLFTNENDFLKKASEGKVVKAVGKEITVVFENLKPGDYAVSVIHDENENGELDSNMIGIPKEGFAFGNNAMGNFGPPSFDKAKITLKHGSDKQVISLKYF